MSRRPTLLVSHSLADKPDLLWNEYWKRSRTVIEIDPPVKLDAPVKEDAVRFVCISDTHMRFSEMVEENKIPAGDVLLHCGDFTDVGRRDEYIEFNELLGQLSHRFKIVIAGNHDLGCEDGENVERRALGDNTSDLVKEGTEQGYKLLTNCTYLQDSSTEGWSFYRANGPEIMAEWRKIPTSIDVLMTHTPPLGHLDQCDVGHVGSADLLDVVEKSVKPKFHVFGHIHEQHGVTTNNVTTFINASTCGSDQDEGPLWNPICFDIPLPSGYTKEDAGNPQPADENESPPSKKAKQGASKS
ncbi:Protein C25E10.12 [Aphelenchoides avenae]|nr:Protein C25E10.12 [Aphelenchus avenae]